MKRNPDVLDRLAPLFESPGRGFEDLLRRRDKRQRARKIGAIALVTVIAATFVGAALRSGDGRNRQPADPPEDLGIFEPVAGRIVYYTDSSLWGVDPNAPSLDSTLVRIDLGGTADAHLFPLGWSSDGTELLFMREDPTDQTYPYTNHLYILHADGSETQVTPEPVGSGAAISPDGSRVVFAPNGEGLYIVDAEGGQPVRIAHEGASPTFSPDGTQIAYLSLPRSRGMVQKGREHVWVANADGTDAHEILADEPALAKGVFELTWSPSGDRIAMANGLEGHVAIYTFAPDGSDFTEVITGGFNPYWSPDGSQIAYGVPGRDGVSLADADGSNVRAFGFAASGPWHPGTSVEDAPPTPPENPTPTPPAWSPVHERGALLVHRGQDPPDAPVGWVDIRHVGTNDINVGTWIIELAAKPPQEADREPGLLIAYGLVLETTGDGIADYLVGIDNDAPERGDFHIWVTDLATGDTDEQIGPPYGSPIEFSHPDETRSGTTMVFTFLSAPAGLNPETVRFYAWASATRDGEVFAWDYAPDTGWMRGMRR